MKYILCVVLAGGTKDQFYQEIDQDGICVRNTDLSGNDYILPQKCESKVVDSKPQQPDWALPDPIKPAKFQVYCAFDSSGAVMFDSKTGAIAWNDPAVVTVVKPDSVIPCTVLHG